MIKSFNIRSNLNEFFQNIEIKKQLLNKFKLKSYVLKHSVKTNNSSNGIIKLFVFLNKQHFFYSNLVFYVVNLTFSKSNIFVNITDSNWLLKFFICSGNLFYKGKNKKAKTLVLKSVIEILLTKIKFLKHKSIALHLKNTGFILRWLISKFKNSFIIKVIKCFTSYSHNGCWLSKQKRTK